VIRLVPVAANGSNHNKRNQPVYGRPVHADSAWLADSVRPRMGSSFALLMFRAWCLPHLARTSGWS
jgi:hypothetical protein